MAGEGAASGGVRGIATKDIAMVDCKAGGEVLLLDAQVSLGPE